MDPFYITLYPVILKIYKIYKNNILFNIFSLDVPDCNNNPAMAEG